MFTTESGQYTPMTPRSRGEKQNTSLWLTIYLNGLTSSHAHPIRPTIVHILLILSPLRSLRCKQMFSLVSRLVHPATVSLHSLKHH